MDSGSRTNPAGPAGPVELQPGDALVVVDVQRDFLPGGALGVPEGDRVVPVLNRYIACFRAHGLPARYMSGYLLTQPPPGQPRLMGADASHAWVSAWSPQHGWVGFDPTNATLADERFVVLGWGHDFGDVAPLRGVILGGGEQRLTVEVSVWPVGV